MPLKVDIIDDDGDDAVGNGDDDGGNGDDDGDA